MFQVFGRAARDLPGVSQWIFRWIMPWGVTFGCLWILIGQFPEMTQGGVWAQVRAVSAGNWMLAVSCTLLSFWALGRYDAIAHRQLGTGLRERHGRFAGQVAIAFSQTIGFGLATGTFARWRMIPGLSTWTSLQLTLFVSVSFLVALSAIVAMFWIARVSLILAGVVAAALAAGTAVLLFFYPAITVYGRKFNLPSIPTAGSVLHWTAVDIAAAGTALYVLMPQGTVSYSDLMTAYVIALGIAVFSGAPGGVGPFELAFTALLSHHDAGALAAGIICFRLVYFAIPALIGALFLLMPPRTSQFLTDSYKTMPFRHGVFPHAETAVVRQTGGELIVARRTKLAVLRLGQTCLAMFDPIGRRKASAFKLLTRVAKSGNKIPAIYKASPATAVTARKLGWKVVKVAEDAIIDPGSFTESGSNKRQLRRKLRSVESAGIKVSASYTLQDLPRMSQIDHAWQMMNGTARGLSMGRFSPDYVARQIVFTARRDDQIEAYLSLHIARDEWALDLMRSSPLCPDGTMHALVVAAIKAAKRHDIARFSLAACPSHALAPKSGKGLRQFKETFAPRWQPRYLIAPSWSGLSLAALDIAYAVHNPAPLAAPHPVANTNDVQLSVENYEFASNGAT